MIDNRQKSFSEPLSVNDETDSQQDLLRVKRREKVTDICIEKLIAAVQTYTIQMDVLYIEAQELKATRESLKSDMQQTLKLEIDKLGLKLIEELKYAVNQNLCDALKSNEGQIQKIQREAEKTTLALTAFAKKNRKRFVIWGASLFGTVFLSCFVIASLIFYFFPQQLYVRYEMTAEHTKQMLSGKSLLNNFKKLKQEDQKLIADAIEIDIKQMK